MSEHMSPIPSRLYNAAVGGHVCGPEDVDFGQKVVHLIKYDKDGNEVSFESQVTQANKIYVIHDDFVLSSNVTIPVNCILQFDGGSISGAYTLTGQNTYISSDQVTIFHNILIAGTWKNKKVYSVWFENITDSLKQLFNLTSAYVDNDVFIGVETYNITPIEGRPSIYVKNYTNVFCNGTIQLVTSNYSGAKLFNLKSNTTWQGGILYGDIDTNQSENPQYGHGFELEGSLISLSNVYIKNCNGDGIYIVEGSKNIDIRNLKIEHCSRNGISVIGQENINIENCIISDVQKTFPKACIDIEPNTTSLQLRNITVNNIKCSNAASAVAISGNPQDSGNIAINNVVADNTISWFGTCFVTKAMNVTYNNIIGKNLVITYGTGPITINNSTLTNLVIGSNMYHKNLYVKNTKLNIVLSDWVQINPEIYIEDEWVYNLGGSFENCEIIWDDNNDSTKNLILVFGDKTTFKGNYLRCKKLIINAHGNIKHQVLHNNRLFITYLGFVQSNAVITLSENYIAFRGNTQYLIYPSSATAFLTSRLINNVINLDGMDENFRTTMVLDSDATAVLFTKNTIIDNDDKLMNIGANRLGFANSNNIIIRNGVIINTVGNIKIDNGDMYYHNGTTWVKLANAV